MNLASLPLLTRSRLAIGASVLFAIGVPVLLLVDWSEPSEDRLAVVPEAFSFVAGQEPTEALAAPLFNAGRIAPEGDIDGNGSDAAAVSEGDQRPVLVGLIAGGRSANMALLRVSSGDTIIAHDGDVVAGWTITRITRSGAFVARGGEQQELTLDYSNKVGEAGSALPENNVNGARQ